MSTYINVSVLLELHEENGSSIIDGGHLLHWVLVEHHDYCKTSHINWKSNSVEASPFSNSTNMRLDSFNGKLSILVVCEIMVQVLKTQHLINIIQIYVEFMSSYPTVVLILS